VQEIAAISVNRWIASGVICNAGGRLIGFRLLLIAVAPIRSRFQVGQPSAVFGRDHRTLLGNDGGTFGGTVCRRTCLLQDRPPAAVGDRILGHDRTPQGCAGFPQGRRGIS
jgi:hypothetical protein